MSDAPLTVVGVSDAVSLATSGEASFCVTRTGGAIACWGNNYQGVLGAGLLGLNSTVAVPVLTISNAVSIVGNPGANAYCAVLSTHGVDCWGDNSVNQLGSGSDPDTVPFGAPLPVSGP
jgi:alpha-tubulin suppressor-like RCC1 family protein